jgi:hypothetical protein
MTDPRCHLRHSSSFPRPVGVPAFASAATTTPLGLEGHTAGATVPVGLSTAIDIVAPTSLSFILESFTSVPGERVSPVVVEPVLVREMRRPKKP